jgi:hypothetical protein
MPKWFKLFFRMCVALLLSGVIFVVVTSAISAASQVRAFYSFFFGSPIDIFRPVALLFSPINFFILGLFAFAALLIVLLIFYGAGLLRFQRWTLHVLLFFVASSLFVGALGIMLGNFVGIDELIGTVVGLVFVFGVGYGAWVYRTAFVGSTRKLWMQIPLLAVLAPTVFFSTLSQIYTDDDAIHDADLLLPDMVVLPEADNAHFALLIPPGTLSREEISSLDKVHEYYRALEQGRDIDIGSASIALENLTEVADRFIAASQKPGYQCPSLMDPYDPGTWMCPMGSVLDRARILVLHSYIEATRGNVEVALESALAPARLGKLISAEQPPLDEHLVGIALVRIGVESIERIVNKVATPLSRDTASAIVRELETYELDGSSLEKSLKWEYVFGKETLRPFERFGGHLWHHNRTNNELAEWMRRNIAVARTTCDGNTVEQKISALKADIDKRSRNISGWTFIKPNGIGEAFIDKKVRNVSESVIIEPKSVVERIFLERDETLKPTVISNLGDPRKKECEVNEINEALQQRLRAI